MRRLLPVILLLTSVSAAAQTRDPPYWASIRAGKAYMRVGPSENYPIDWVYKRKNLPVKVVRLKEGWRLVRDPDGTEGWMMRALLSDERSAIVVGDGLAAIRAEPRAGAPLRWNAEPGVVGMLGDCDSGWCEFDVEGRKGWIEEARLWGAGEP